MALACISNLIWNPSPPDSLNFRLLSRTQMWELFLESWCFCCLFPLCGMLCSQIASHMVGSLMSFRPQQKYPSGLCCLLQRAFFSHSLSVALCLRKKITTDIFLLPCFLSNYQVTPSPVEYKSKDASHVIYCCILKN